MAKEEEEGKETAWRVPAGDHRRVTDGYRHEAVQQMLYTDAPTRLQAWGVHPVRTRQEMGISVGHCTGPRVRIVTLMLGRRGTRGAPARNPTPGFPGLMPPSITGPSKGGFVLWMINLL